MFSRIVIPEIVRSDNGPQHNSGEFKRFTKDWGFQHIPSSPEHPRSNDLAEKVVQTAKNLLEKAKENNKDPYLALLYTFYFDVQLDNCRYYMITCQRGIIISSYFP